MPESVTIKCPRCGGTGHIDNPVAIGEQMRKLRLAKGIGLREIAQDIGFSAPYVSDLERGRRAWSPNVKRWYLQSIKHWKNAGVW